MRRFNWHLPWGERCDSAVLSRLRNIWSTLLDLHSRLSRACTMRTCSPSSLPLSSLEISCTARILLHFSFFVDHQTSSLPPKQSVLPVSAKCKYRNT